MFKTEFKVESSTVYDQEWKYLVDLALHRLSLLYYTDAGDIEIFM